jgi:hypothetical protein
LIANPEIHKSEMWLKWLAHHHSIPILWACEQNLLLIRKVIFFVPFVCRHWPAFSW